MSATGTKRSTQTGLTLVELLVVLVAMAVVTGLTVMALPPSRSAAERMAFAIAADIESQRVLTIMDARPRGLFVDGPRLILLEFDNGQWQRTGSVPIMPLKDVGSVRLQMETPESFVFPEEDGNVPTLMIEGSEASDTNVINPPVQLGPTGEVTPANLTVQDANSVWRLTIIPDGSVEVIRE